MSDPFAPPLPRLSSSSPALKAKKRKPPQALTLSLLLLLTLWLALLPAPSHAQGPNKGSEPTALIESARKNMEGVRSGLRTGQDDAALVEVRRRALEAQAQADQAAAALGAELAEVKARLAELGTPAPDVKEPADIAGQRSQLVRSQSTLDSQVKLARLLSVEAEQAASSVKAQRRSQFSAELLERTPAVTSAEFWRELTSELPNDLGRSSRLVEEMQDRFGLVSMGAWWLLALVSGLALLGRRPVKKWLVRLITTRVPAGRLRRSLHATSSMVLWTLTPGIIAHALYLALTSGTPAISDELQALLAGFDGIVWFGGFTVGLGLALLMPDRPSWRLPPVSNATAQRLRLFPLALACGMVLGWVTTRLYAAAEASLASTVALKTLASVTLLLMMMGALSQIRRASREDAQVAPPTTQSPGQPPGGAPLWWPTLNTLAWLLLSVTLVGLLSGFVALGSFVVNQVVWALIVLSCTYLLAMLIDDLFMTLLAPTAQPADSGGNNGATGGSGSQPSTPKHRTREQTAVLLSGACRIGLVLLALMLLLAPFGEGPMDLYRRVGQINEGLSIGQISLRPTTLLQGLVVLVLGLFAVRRLKKWLADRLMPTTRMDASMRMSVTTLFGYAGAITVVALAMSAVGVGLERVAWVASALSVGIGFGLQAVVQNFVSGLILLAERPVKVGDWVSLAGIEGDIRRINVRATEIQMGDRSTVIVPNSELITKMVRNVTYTDPLGMVQIKLPMPLNTDTGKARAVLLEAFTSHPSMLETPKPNVQLDSVDGVQLMFNATGFVNSPRAVGGVKSDLLFDVLERLRDAGLELARPPSMILSSPNPVLPAGTAVAPNAPTQAPTLAAPDTPRPPA